MTTVTLADVAERIGKIQEQTKGQLDAVRDLTKDQAEYREKTDKIAEELKETMEVLQDIRTRADEKPGDFSEKGALELVEKGVTSFSLRDKNNQKVGVGLSRFSGEYHDFDERLSPQARDTLRLVDEVFLADGLVSANSKAGKDYERQKMQEGEEAAFCQRFPELGARYKALRDTLDNCAKKALGDGMNTATSNAGGDWIPTGFASNALDEIRLQIPEIGIFQHIQMPTNPWTWPIVGSIADSKIRTENTTINRSNPTTENRTWTAKTFAVYSSWSDEVGQDSIIPILPFLRANQIRSLGEAFSVAVISGDTSSPHIDSDYQALSADHPAKAFDGLREYCMSGAADVNYHDCSNGVLTAALIRAGLENMGKWATGASGGGLSSVVGLITTKQWIQLLGEANLLTLDKFGPQATILSGEIGRVHNIPFLLSFGLEERKNSLGATGINSATTTDTRNAALLVNRNYWYIGDRRDIRVEQDKDIVAGRNDIVTTARWAFNKTHATAATDVHTQALINLV